MPAFPALRPVHLTLVVDLCQVEILTWDRDQVTVDVLPRDASAPPDVDAAARIHVERSAASVRVTQERYKSQDGAVRVRARVPAGSTVYGAVKAGDFRTTGRLGECRLSTGFGDIRMEWGGALRLDATFGSIAVDRIDGDVDARVENGDIRMQTIQGDASLTVVDHGNILVDRVLRSIRVRTTEGDVDIGRAEGATAVEASWGDITVDRVERDVVTLTTGVGRIELGIAPGTEARLTLEHPAGNLYQSLDLLTEDSSPIRRTVYVEATSEIGDIVLRRPCPTR